MLERFQSQKITQIVFLYENILINIISKDSFCYFSSPSVNTVKIIHDFIPSNLVLDGKGWCICNYLSFWLPSDFYLTFVWTWTVPDGDLESCRGPLQGGVSRQGQLGLLRHQQRQDSWILRFERILQGSILMNNLCQWLRQKKKKNLISYFKF